MSAARLFLWALALALLVFGAAHPISVAEAQPAGQHQPGDGHGHGHGEAPTASADSAVPKGALGTSRHVALLFWLVASATIAGALFVITRRNLISAVMGMVGTFFALAVLYTMLYAHFMAVIQVLVYAGAIMVLFVFVIMIINRDEEHPWAIEGILGKCVAAGALAYLLVRLSQVLWSVKDSVALKAPEAVPSFQEGALAYEWGTSKAIGRVLFTEYLFPFEAVSIVLLVAVVGAIYVARPSVTMPVEEERGGPQ